MNPLSAIRLSELSAKVTQAIHAAFRSASFWVIADVTSHTFKPVSNYHYFELVEKDSGSNNIIAKFSAKSWGSGSQKIAGFERVTGQKFQSNINVLVNVTVEYHATYGLQLTVIDIDVNYTIGALEQQKQATLARLLKNNLQHVRLVGDRYQTANQDLALNTVLQHIAVISSGTSAGFQDFKHTLETNNFGYRFKIDTYFTLIQGDSNADAFVEKIIEVYQSRVKYDALVIIRGGGAQTDLLIFDNYSIARAIARLPIPVITGIGHHKNETVADLMAHTSTKTPTKAAEFILSHNKSFEDELLNFQKAIVIKSQQLLSARLKLLTALNQLVINTTKSMLFKHKSQLLDTAAHLLSRPKMMIYHKKADLKNITGNIATFNAMFLKNQRGYLGHYISVIKLMSPANILNKGFAIVKVNGEITSDPGQIVIGKDIAILLGPKEIGATIKTKKDYHGSDFNL